MDERYRLSCDVGGTFTDLVAVHSEGTLRIAKASTTPERLISGLGATLDAAAEQLSVDRGRLLAATDLFVYATTQATNAVLEGKTARTALLVTEGFPDVLVRREGGSLHPYDFSRPSPPPYIPRRLTFEITERIDADGRIVRALDEAQARAVIERLGLLGVEAVAVCLLWSISDPRHELRLGELIEELLPGVPVTLSHRLNPIIREYRRASCTAIDASLKPLMQSHLREVERTLRDWGLSGELLAATSLGGLLPMRELIERPIYAARSGPSLAPVAGRYYAELEMGSADAIVCDTGGTSFDVGLVRDGAIVTTRETWLGEPFAGHLTGLSSVDVRSIGAGGGSIATVDAAGLLRVGPESAGADPGPACYGRGGTAPTVTDAALLLGYLDPDRFLGGRMKLDSDAASRVLEPIAERLGLSLPAAAHGVLTVANEHMVSAISEITISQGLDPRESPIVAGGGAAGLGIVEIARSLGLKHVIVPRTAGALSAFGAQCAEIVIESSRNCFARSDDFPHAEVSALLAELERDLDELSSELQGAQALRIDRSVDARYAHQAWELEVPVPEIGVGGADGLAALVASFHDAHERIFAVREPGQVIETMHWRVRLRAGPRDAATLTIPNRNGGGAPHPADHRLAYFPHTGPVSTPVFDGASLSAGSHVAGPALIAEPTTTIVLPPGSSASVSPHGNYRLSVDTP